MLDDLLGRADRFVVVDVETTGVYNSDRVVEVATVTVDGSGVIVDEWDTLVDPGRDVGPTHLHGVTASMVSTAPRFEEVAAALAERLYGAALVAHNRPFDTRMLRNEFERLDARLVDGAGVCTMQLGGGKLVDVCRGVQVELINAHRALGDARATAQVLTRLAENAIGTCSPARVFDITAAYSSRTLQREMVGEAELPMPYLARLASSVHHYGESGASLAYLDLLDWALADLSISEEESQELWQLGNDLGMSQADVSAAHRRYIDELVAAALRDQVVTDDELSMLHRAAEALGVAQQTVDQATSAWRPDSGDGVSLEPGIAVCFTGSATYPDGTKMQRGKLIATAERLGLRPVSGVTKSGCDLLVAADTSSQSGKAGKARQYGIPLVEVHDFLKAQPGSTVPAIV